MLYFVAFVGGIAGLTWELLWMHHTALSLGVSAQGAALTFVALSLGMATGSLAIGRLLERRPIDLLRAWGLLELGIGLAGQALEPGFASVAAFDARLWQTNPSWAPLGQAVGMLSLLFVPAACMGATIPVLAAVAKRHRLSIAALYANNVAGASLGILLATFVFVPGVGIETTVDLASLLNVALAAALLVGAMRRRAAMARTDADPKVTDESSVIDLRTALAVVAATGFVTFTLEVAWFRSFRAAFQATTESFALILFTVLLALAAGSFLAAWLRRHTVSLGTWMAVAAALVLVTTPLVERVDDLLAWMPATGYGALVVRRLLASVFLLGPSMLLIGVALPWCLEALPGSRRAAWIYASNTAASVVGSLLAAWVLLPTIGFARTAWVAGLVLGMAAWTAARPPERVRVLALALAGLLVAWTFASDVGRARVQTNQGIEHEVLAIREGPDATVSVIRHPDDTRHLVIDGFYATGTNVGAHYMPWMGHLPMMMHPDPRRALVICFGTGQTTNAVRNEGPERLDVVDVSASVFGMAEHFPENEDVLSDPRVHAHTMDGRAWLRRSTGRYDVVTLEPMPPTFAGSNALYSLEFYQLVADRLAPDGVVAQWLPFHLVDPIDGASITATFMEVFEDTRLWIDPSGTGILLGRLALESDRAPFPGLARPVPRNMSPQAVVAALRYGPSVLEQYGQIGRIVTDDNQHLSYGWGRQLWWWQGEDPAATTLYHHLLLQALEQPGDLEDKLRAFTTRVPDVRAIQSAR